ncbi:MAG: hypothetical protein L3J32_10490 [Rhizobiaceae bacterium]|nr:hypothetical protein [Rhizobiaceae bacterium]
MFNLPKLLILILVVGAVWYIYRAIKREMNRVREELRKAEVDKSSTGEPQPLVKDKDGIYRLKDD